MRQRAALLLGLDHPDSLLSTNKRYSAKPVVRGNSQMTTPRPAYRFIWARSCTVQPRAIASPGILAAAGTFFDNAPTLPDLVAYGYSAAQLAAERAKITVYADANAVQEAAKGTTRQAVREQAAALQALHEWMARFIKIARVRCRISRSCPRNSACRCTPVPSLRRRRLPPSFTGEAGLFFSQRPGARLHKNAAPPFWRGGACNTGV
jgi:hypothetical protein